MKRLLNSSKFFLILIGTVGAVATHQIVAENKLTLALAVLSAFTSGALATAIEDAAEKRAK